MSSIESISQDTSSSTPVSLPNSDGLSVFPIHEMKNSQQTSDHRSAEGPQLITWVSNKLTDMKKDMLATGISEKFDGANTAVNSCGDGALGNSLNSTYSSAVRISQLDLDEASSDEEVAIEVEYVPKDIGLEDPESQACNLMRTMHQGKISHKTGESYFAVSPNVSASSIINSNEMNGNVVPILGNECAISATDTLLISTEKKNR